jgi:hypothetical protein
MRNALVHLLFLGRVSASAVDGVLRIWGRGDYVQIRFEEGVLPLFRKSSAVPEKIEGRECMFRGGKEIEVPYVKHIRSRWSPEDEDGVRIATVTYVGKSGSTTQEILDKIVLPDFTTPFLSFGVAGSVLCAYFSSMVKFMCRTF